jgi:hypothetical protein
MDLLTSGELSKLKKFLSDAESMSALKKACAINQRIAKGASVGALQVIPPDTDGALHYALESLAWEQVPYRLLKLLEPSKQKKKGKTK